MRYVSTRGAAPVLDFRTVTLTGLASDGGLYVPEVWPTLSHDAIAGLAGLSYVDTAVAVMMPFVGGTLTADELRGLCDAAYGRFAHAAVTPHVPLVEDRPAGAHTGHAQGVGRRRQGELDVVLGPGQVGTPEDAGADPTDDGVRA